jgi:hypothetical protein
MLRHLKSAAARSPMRSPPPHPPSAPAPRDEGFEEEEEEEESARAIAVSDQRTIYLVRPAFTRPLTPSPISTVDLIWWCSTFGVSKRFWSFGVSDCVCVCVSLSALQVNMFIANTVEFLNSFAAQCNDKLSLLHR